MRKLSKTLLSLLLIAAMSAEGTSTIQNIEQIDRGYKDIDGRLNALGARITRVEE
jgi:UDP-N-acetylglucosamine 1-carboxyvinyltransferase